MILSTNPVIITGKFLSGTTLKDSIRFVPSNTEIIGQASVGWNIAYDAVTLKSCVWVNTGLTNQVMTSTPVTFSTGSLAIDFSFNLKSNVLTKLVSVSNNVSTTFWTQGYSSTDFTVRVNFGTQLKSYTDREAILILSCKSSRAGVKVSAYVDDNGYGQLSFEYIGISDQTKINLAQNNYIQSDESNAVFNYSVAMSAQEAIKEAIQEQTQEVYNFISSKFVSR